MKGFSVRIEFRLAYLPNSVREDPVTLPELLKKTGFAFTTETERKNFI